jgi:hypothetical protein
VLAVPASSPLRASLLATGTVIVLILALVVWKGISLSLLSSRIDAQARVVGTFYAETIRTDTAAIARDALTPAEQDALTTLTQVKMDTRQDLNALLTTVVAMQQGCMRLFDSVQVDDALAKDPGFITLKKHLGKEGDATKRIEPYNASAQSWNNEQDDWLGSWYFRLLGLKPRQLLNANGTVEYETKVSI